MNTKYLRECRLKKFTSQEKAAEYVGISFQMYRSIETGRRVGTLATVTKLCKAFDMDANKLLDLE